MHSGGIPVARKSSVIQANGQVTLLREFRKKYGLKKGDKVVFREIDGGLLIDASATLALKLLDDLGEALEKRHISLEELLASSQEVRPAICDEEYVRDAE